MTIETKQVTLTVLNAAEGSWLTQAADVSLQDRIFTKQAYLGSKDSPENWKEVTDAEKEALEAPLKGTGEVPADN